MQCLHVKHPSEEWRCDVLLVSTAKAQSHWRGLIITAVAQKWLLPAEAITSISCRTDEQFIIKDVIAVTLGGRGISHTISRILLIWTLLAGNWLSWTEIWNQPGQRVSTHQKVQRKYLCNLPRTWDVIFNGKLDPGTGEHCLRIMTILAPNTQLDSVRNGEKAEGIL